MVSREKDGSPVDTPMMRQYLSMKERHRDEILFFRMGDFYEMFFDDARVASEILGIALTSRSKDREAIPMAGVPVRAVDSYLPRLVEAGKRVAICEQVQDPREASGLVDREVVRVVSPGTLTDEKLIGQKSNNFIASVFLDARGAGLAWIDLSTGEFLVWESADAALVYTELSRIEPAECVLPESSLRGLESRPELARAVGAAFRSSLPDWVYDRDTAYRTLTGHFRTGSLEGFGCETLDRAIRAGGALMHYLIETQKKALRHIARMRPFPGSSFMVLDAATRQALELTRTYRGGQRSGSLLDAIDHTVTAMGARRLREWILKPLHHVDAIVYRQEAVERLVLDPDARTELIDLLRQIHDIERICSRVSYGSANARDLVSLAASLETLPHLRAIIESSECRFYRDRLADLEGFEDLVSRVQAALVDAPPIAVREGGMIRPGLDAELDRLHAISEDGTSWLAEFQRREAEESGIQSLKVGYNKVFGYYIEVTNTHAAKVPRKYIRKQTLKNCERYITPELKDFENEVLHARENAMELEYRIFCELRDAVAERIYDLQVAAEAVASIDAIASFARIAVERNYVRPLVDEGFGLDIEEGRHPVLELGVPEGDFVPNGIHLEHERPIVIITGPNMAGKSTYIRQIALLTLLAHTGSFIPARRAAFGRVDRIFTRVGAADDISRGQSTFMVEMFETANIINNATGRSLLILDEVGRGTSTFDGLSLAWAITEHIAAKLQSRTLFATHYHELTELSLTTPLVRNATIAVKEWNDDIVFLRKVVDGAADKSYGIHVARLAGLPRDILDRARTLLANLEAQALDIHGLPSFAPKREETPGRSPGEPSSSRDTAPLQLDLFRDANEPVLRELKNLDLEGMTPLEAMLFLAEIQKRIV